MYVYGRGYFNFVAKIPSRSCCCALYPYMCFHFFWKCFYCSLYYIIICRVEVVRFNLVGVLCIPTCAFIFFENVFIVLYLCKVVMWKWLSTIPILSVCFLGFDIPIIFWFFIIIYNIIYKIIYFQWELHVHCRYTPHCLNIY